MSVTKLQYPKPWRWYNSERRESRGVVEDTIESDYIFYDTQHFIVDLSNATEDDPYRLVLFTFSNGVKLVWDMYKSSESSRYYTIRVKKYLFDKNDVEIDGLSWQQTYLTIYKQQYSDLTHVDLFYSTSLAYYYSSNYLQPFGIVSTYNATASPYDAPNITNNTVGRSRYANYYLRNYAYDINIDTDAKLNDLMTKLENGGNGTPITPISPSEDISGEGGGDDADPDYNPFTDDVDFPALPTITALSSGMISAYNPDNSMLTQLGQKLWSTNVIEELKKIWNDPMEGIISLHLMPFTPPIYGSKECKIGSYNTEIVMPTIISQFVQKYCGSVKVSERFASALDYSPYTTAYIHIPFVGIVPLDIDYIMNKTLDLRYQIDVLTGNGVAMLRCDGAILYEFPCNLAMSIPLTSVNHGALYRSIIDVAGNAGHAVVAGATGSGASAVANGVVRTLESALNTIASKHSEVQKSGAITGGAGMLDVFEAYLIFHRPIQSLASDFNHFKGYPCNITYTLSELSGYTEVEYAHLEGVTATDEEKDEIQTLLQTGVIL